MFSVSPIEPIVSLDDASLSQADDQSTSAEVCVIEDVVSVQDVKHLPLRNVGVPINGLTSSVKDVAQQTGKDESLSIHGSPATNKDVALTSETITYMSGASIEPIVFLGDAPVSQADDQSTSAEVPVVEDEKSVQSKTVESESVESERDQRIDDLVLFLIEVDPQDDEVRMLIFSMIQMDMMNFS